jgi:hypothetical protein
MRRRFDQERRKERKHALRKHCCRYIALGGVTRIG